MHIYYVAGVPYSDDLYHSGVKGQKWGIRRYQYEDGTLTPLGKIHYGAQKVGRAIGNSAKKVGRHAIDKVKAKHTWMMSDSELEERTKRVQRENNYKELAIKNKKIGKGESLSKDILRSGIKTLGTKAFNELGDKLFGKKEKPIRDLADVLADDKATEKELDAALKVYKAKGDLEKDKSARSYYDINNLGDTRNMSKLELDNLNAWLSSERRTTEAIRKTEEYDAGRKALDDWLASRSDRGYDYHTRRI